MEHVGPVAAEMVVARRPPIPAHVGTRRRTRGQGLVAVVTGLAGPDAGAAVRPGHTPLARRLGLF